AAVVLGAPPEVVTSDILELPPRAPGVPIEAIARAEVARIHKCDPSSFAMSLWDLPTPARGSKTTSLMAVRCPTAAAEAYLDTVEAESLNVVALDVRTSAAARACLPLAAPPPALTAVLDVGWHAIVLAVLNKGLVTY